MVKNYIVLSIALLLGQGALGTPSSTDSLARAIVHEAFAPSAQKRDAKQQAIYYARAYENCTKADLRSVPRPEFGEELQMVRELCVAAIGRLMEEAEVSEYAAGCKNRALWAFAYGMGSMIFHDEAATQRMMSKLCHASGLVQPMPGKKLNRIVFFEAMAYGLDLLSKEIPDDLLLQSPKNAPEVVKVIQHTAWGIRYVSLLKQKDFAPQTSAQLVMAVFDAMCELVA